MARVKIVPLSAISNIRQPLVPRLSGRVRFGVSADTLALKGKGVTGVASPLQEGSNSKPPSFTALVMALARQNVDPVSARWARQTLVNNPSLRGDLEQRLGQFCQAFGVVVPASSSRSKLAQFESTIDVVLKQVASPYFKQFYEGRHQFSQGLIHQALAQGHRVVIDEFGAGLDPVVHTFTKGPKKQAVFINEHDEQATQQYKRELLGKKLPKNVRLHGLNFERANDQRDKMILGRDEAQTFFKGQPVHHMLFMKGLLYYLEPQAVQRLFTDALETYPVGTQIFADCYTHQNWQGTDPLTFRYRKLLETLGEHVKFTTNALHQDLAKLRSADGRKKLVLEAVTPRGQASAPFVEDPATASAVSGDPFGNSSLFYQLKIVSV